MITKHDAILIGTAVCKAVQLEQANISPSPAVFNVRGTGCYAMDNIWYDVLSNKVKEAFNFDRESYFKACGWPE
jgi:hypothetical protein